MLSGSRVMSGFNVPSGCNRKATVTVSAVEKQLTTSWSVVTAKASPADEVMKSN